MTMIFSSDVLPVKYQNQCGQMHPPNSAWHRVNKPTTALSSKAFSRNVSVPPGKEKDSRFNRQAPSWEGKARE